MTHRDVPRILQRYLPPAPPPVQVRRQVSMEQRRTYLTADDQLHDQAQRRRALRGIPAIGQDSGQPNDERRDPRRHLESLEGRPPRRWDDELPSEAELRRASDQLEEQARGTGSAA